MTIMAHNGIIFPNLICTPYLDHVSDSEVLYTSFILEENIVSVQKVEHIIRYHLVIINVWCTCPSQTLHFCSFQLLLIMTYSNVFNF